jgi:hypothetical protein
MSPLERLKEKIRKRKEASKATSENADVTKEDENGWEEMNDDLAQVLGAKKKKLSKFERRQRRLDELRAAPLETGDLEDDEPLFAAKETTSEMPKYTPAELKALSALKKQKLRIKSDGSFNVRGAGGLGKSSERVVFEDDN